MHGETRLANPDADAKAFALKFKLALWEVDVKKKGSNSGGNLGEVDLSFLSGTDGEERSGEESDSSEEGMKAITDDLARQKQVSPPSSPKENRYLAGFMKSLDKQPPDAQAKQALDKDPISLFSPLEQAENSTSAKKQGRRTGDVPGHGGSMSVQHGSPSLDPPDDAPVANRRSAADVIRKGSSLSLSQTTDAERMNFVAPSQVDSSSGTLMLDKPGEEQSSMEKALALFQLGSKCQNCSSVSRLHDKQGTGHTVQHRS